MNQRQRTLPQRTTARGGGSERYHFRLDAETFRQLQEAVTWFEGNDMSYSESCIVRAAIREYLQQLQAKDADSPDGAMSPENLAGTVRSIELARRGA